MAIEPTDKMFRDVQRAIDEAPGTGAGEAIRALLPLVERQLQKALDDAFQAGWRRGQHQLCPRCGDELERDLAQEAQP